MFPQIFGKYVLEREIASGGMAHVYLAMLRGAVGFQKRLVVKQIRPELASDPAFVERFVEEAKTTVELNHPNIVPVYELGVEQGVYYIALEFCEGITLGDLLSATGPLAPDEGAYLGVEICRALDYAHRRAQVVHRDVTPRNVLIDEEGAVRLIDFGIAAPVRSDGEAIEAFGSPGHMPPEQLRGGVTPATDVFAAAALLLEAWSGVAPFRRATGKASHAAVLNEPPAAASSAHPSLSELDVLIASAVDPDQAKRPQDAEQLGRPLRDFLRSFDRRDVERRLGARVREARRSAAGSVASIPDLGRSQGSGQVYTLPDGSTQTFAAHQEIELWTRRVEGVAGVDQDVDQLLGQEKLTPKAPALVDPDRTPPMAATGPKTRRIELPEPAPPPDAAAEYRDAERPLATDKPAPERPSAEESTGKKTALWFAALALGVLAVLVVRRGMDAEPAVSGGPGMHPSALASQARSSSSGALPQPTQRAAADGAGAAASAGSPALAVQAHAAGLRSAPNGSTQAPARPVVGTPASAASPSGASGGSSAAPSASAAAESATLSLTSIPPSRVTLGGRPRGTTPLMGLRLAPGSYAVVFTNPTLGESVPAQIRLLAGQSRTLHADFTAVTPRVIQR